MNDQKAYDLGIATISGKGLHGAVRVAGATRSSIRKVGRIIGIILAIPVAIAVVFAGLLLFWSPGTTRPILDGNGDAPPNSISEMVESMAI